MKKVLFVATVVQKHINVFHLPFLKLFQEEGYRTYVAAANDTDHQDVAIPYCDEYIEIAFKRNPFHPRNIPAYYKLKKLIRSNDFDIIHCHTPVGGVLGRLASRKARKKGTKVFYTAHGFHFYKGAPLINWLVYYPVEKLCAYLTDVLITINQEDYDLAKKSMKAKRIEYTPGVGIDLSKFESVQVDRSAKRHEIGVPEDAFLLLSVGELNKNKNHQVIIKAIGKLNNENIHYAIAGVGDQKDALLKLANELGLSERVHLLGYRKDIPELNSVADVFCFPSIREGFGLAAIEAMAASLPVIAANSRGTREYVVPNVNGYFHKHDDVDGFAESINNLAKDKESDSFAAFSNRAHDTAKRFQLMDIVKQMKDIYTK